jgi:hypothetical protein
VKALVKYQNQANVFGIMIPSLWVMVQMWLYLEKKKEIPNFLVLKLVN